MLCNKHASARWSRAFVSGVPWRASCVVAAESFDPGAPSQPFQWSSEYADTELDMVYYNYRYYNPTDGRWVGRDPIGESAGKNLIRYIDNNPVLYFDYLGYMITEQMFIDCFYVKAFLITKGFFGYNENAWEPSDSPRKGKSPIFVLKISGFWKTFEETQTPEGNKCTCSCVRKLYEDSYPFSVTVEVYDIDMNGKESLRCNQPYGLPLKTLLGQFHEQELTWGTILATAAKPKSIVAPGSVSFNLNPSKYKGIRVIVDVLSQTIYNQVHSFLTRSTYVFILLFYQFGFFA